MPPKHRGLRPGDAMESGELGFITVDLGRGVNRRSRVDANCRYIQTVDDDQCYCRACIRGTIRARRRRIGMSK